MTEPRPAPGRLSNRPPAAFARIFCAIDTTDLARATHLARAIAGSAGGVKLGKEFFAAQGPEGVRAIAACGLPIFLDLKFHDIPNTVAGAVRAAAALDVEMLTVHASGGAAMIAAAREAAEKFPNHKRPQIVAVTVLTSLDDDDLAAIGQYGPVAAQVERLAALAERSGADGMVCSPREVAAQRTARRAGFRLVVPGVRPASAAAGDDQKRTLTPAEAVSAGADILVIGRPITGAPDPAAALNAIAAEIRAAGQLKT